MFLVLTSIGLCSIFIYCPVISATVGLYNEFTFSMQSSGVDLDQALFQPFPSEIVFQNYTPCEVYEVPLILRNNDKVSMFAGCTFY